MSERAYAGIGSRETPPAICGRMQQIAVWLHKHGYVLRSGGAAGADTAFAAGAGEAKEIYRPDHATPEALDLAARFHPAWDRCSAFARDLHARNGFQVLGPDLCTPSEFVVCWTKDGKASGGTGQALRIAEAYGIPIFNLHDETAAHRLLQHVRRLCAHPYQHLTRQRVGKEGDTP
jgi:hypothetical protein